jgi:hypothetical protein
MLWRASSASIASYPALCLLTFVLCVLMSDESIGVTLVVLVIALGTPIYIIARLILLFLAVFALRDLPRDAYLAVRWTSFLPHIGS